MLNLQVRRGHVSQPAAPGSGTAPAAPRGAAPSADELVEHPERARELPPGVAAEILVRFAGLQALLLRRALAAPAGGPPAAPEADRWLTPEEAAGLLGVRSAWLVRHHKRYPFSRRVSRKQIRFSEQGLRKWLAAKRP